MAKKWKVYPWTAETEHKADDEPVKKHVSDDEEEEIDVVTIHQNAETKPIIQYQTSHDESGSVVEQTPLPPQNYYQTSAEDYPLGENDSKSQLLNAVPSVIQQHTSHPTPQIRLTSVIHHSGTFLQNTNMPQSNQSGIHHSASPMQPQSSWGPSSPTEGATAPSPPPHIQHSSDSDVTTIHYNGKSKILRAIAVLFLFYFIFTSPRKLAYSYSPVNQIIKFARTYTPVNKCSCEYHQKFSLRRGSRPVLR